jgi:hypothetical protein
MHAPFPPRRYCRNPRCRSKLLAPVENEHRAFCCRGCFEAFYRKRCLVCERDITVDPMTGRRRALRQSHRKFCGRKCRAEAARFPHVYTWEASSPTELKAHSTSAHFTGLETALKSGRPPSICGPAAVIGTEVFSGRPRTVVSSDGVICEVCQLGEGGP